MKPEELFLALNEIQDDWLLDALETSPVRRRSAGRRLAAILAAAVLASLLSLTAVAAVTEAGWFQAFFARESQQPLSENQIALVRTSTQELHQSLTCNGYTVTLESIVADRMTCYMKLKITGPEGTVLDNEMGYGSRIPRSPQELYHNFLMTDGSVPAGVGTWDPTDDDPTDNVVPVLYRFSLAEHSEVNFETPGVWRLIIRDLSAWGEGEDTILAPGDLCFDIVFDQIQPDSIFFLSQPMDYTFTMAKSREALPGQIRSLSITAMSGQMGIQAHETDIPVGFNILPVVLKDGTQVELHSRIFGPDQYSYAAQAPIPLEDVDHILLPDGTKLYPPAG